MKFIGLHAPCVFTENLSQAVKMLKGELMMKAIDEHKMDRAIIFCRTKLDCDNAERYLTQHGGGSAYALYFNIVFYYPRT